MRRRTIIFAQSRLRALDWLRRDHPDVNPNGRDIRIVATAHNQALEALRGHSAFDYVTLDGWDFFMKPSEKAEFWDRISMPDIDARQLSPDSLNPI